MKFKKGWELKGSQPFLFSREGSKSGPGGAGPSSGLGVYGYEKLVAGGWYRVTRNEQPATSNGMGYRGGVDGWGRGVAIP